MTPDLLTQDQGSGVWKLANETVLYLHACGKDLDILECFTYLGIPMMSHIKKFYGHAQHEYLALLVTVQMDKDLDLQVNGDPCLTA